MNNPHLASFSACVFEMVFLAFCVLILANLNPKP